MNDWVNRFSSYSHSGIYYINDAKDIGIIKKAAAARSFVFFQVDLKKIKGKSDFLKKVARSLNFPEYFGMNWDALSDCLADMSWKPAAGYVFLFNDFQSFAGRSHEEAKVVRDILDASAKYWKQKAIPFYIVLR